ncbi:MAG TPA: SelT/SelW/SelH family protein [Candidatus Polarisedimenticolia bacterium]
MARRPRLEIEYCTQCRWLLRAAWMAQELLTTFESELGEVALRPGRGGVFKVRLAGRTIFDRARRKRFPESKELKQLVRDVVAPERDLGHSDRPRGAPGESATERNRATARKKAAVRKMTPRTRARRILSG